MTLDEFGRFIRPNSLEKLPSKSLTQVLSETYDKLTEPRSIIPSGEKKSTDLFYWGRGSIKHVEDDLIKMIDLTQKNNMKEFIHEQSHKIIHLGTFFKKLQNSIAYSKDIHARINLKEQSEGEEERQIRRNIGKKLREKGIL